jgi:hypothetical protein
MGYAEDLVRQAHARRCTGSEVLDQHVGFGQQLVEHGRRGAVLEVEREAFLAAVGPDEVRRKAFDARVVAASEVARARSFDLDDAGALVGELARAERCRDRVLEGDDGDAFECSHAES